MVRRRAVGWVLLLGWIVTLVGTVVTGERSSTLARLEADVAAGRVDEVTVVGSSAPLGDGRTGRSISVVEAHWDSGLLGYSAEVVERQPAGARVPEDMREVATGVVDGTLEERLTASAPQLLVVSEDRRGGASGDYLGWHVDGWVAWAGLVLWLATLGRLIYGGPPRRATRWAWFWLLCLVPVGPVAFLLLGGPASGTVHRDTSQRLTGGWAFLIMLVVAPAFAAGAA